MASNRSIIGIYLRACVPQAPMLLTALAFYAVGALLSTTAMVLILRRIVNVLTESQGTREEIFAVAATWFFVMVGNHLLMNVCYRIADFTLVRAEGIVMRDLATATFSKLRAHSLTFFENSFTGSLVAKTRRFVRSFELLQDKFVFGFFILFVHLTGATVTLFFHSVLVGSMFLVWVVFFVAASYALVRWRSVTDIAESEEDSKVTGALSDALTNIRSVQANAAGEREDARFAGAVMNEWRAHVRAVDRHTVIYGVQGLMVVLLEVPAIYLSLRLWRDGVFSTGDFVLIHALLVACSRHMWDLGRSMKDFARGLANASELVDIIDTPIDILNPEHPSDARVTAGAVRFDGVTFSYVPGSPILDRFDLAVRAGERVGIVGKSGAGKTTLTKLLLRFVDPQGGTVTIDGVDIRSMRLDEVRGAIGFVPQDPNLFHRSLRENIAYAKANVTDDEVIAAAKKAHIHEVIAAMPHGYDTLVGERGVKLSGGERQRVLLARVFLQNPRIVLLDEPTSALDSDSERIVQENLRALMEGRTTLAIAHRISTVRAMDRIIVVDKGAILEEGTHDELLAKDGFYAQLWGHQVNGFLPEAD